MKQKKSADNIVVVTDATCFIILHKIDATDLLCELFSSVITTPEVAKEYGKPLPSWVSVLSVKDKDLQKSLSLIVDEGEASAIALAHEIENHYLITDDLQARKLALKLGLPTIGSLRVLVFAKQNNLIEKVAPYIERIKQTNFRINNDLLLFVLKEAGEI